MSLGSDFRSLSLTCADLNCVCSDGVAAASLPPYEECTIVLHFHGGGFISGCSFYHQNYTRQWAMDGLLPVVSCDYRLAPESQFPAALQDAWLCYTWVLQNAQQHLAITPRNISKMPCSASEQSSTELRRTTNIVIFKLKWYTSRMEMEN